MTGKISLDDFSRAFSTKVNLKYVLDVLCLAKAQGDLALFRNALWGLSSLLPMQERLSIYRLMILDNWHHEHEELIMGLQVNFKGEKDNVLFIRNFVNNLPDRFLQDKDIKASIIKKCMYALAAHPESQGIEIIKEFVNSTDEVISRLAKDLLLDLL